MLVHAVYAVFFTHPSNCDVVPHPRCVKGEVPMYWQYFSRWYGLVCHGSILPMSNQSSDTVLNIRFCKTRLCGMCNIHEYPPLNGCNADVLWGHTVCWRARSKSQCGAFAHTILGNVCAAERKQLLFDEAELTSLFLHKQCSSWIQHVYVDVFRVAQPCSVFHNMKSVKCFTYTCTCSS